jgi:hypothetical protein
MFKFLNLIQISPATVNSASSSVTHCAVPLMPGHLEPQPTTFQARPPITLPLGSAFSACKASSVLHFFPDTESLRYCCEASRAPTHGSAVQAPATASFISLHYSIDQHCVGTSTTTSCRTIPPSPGASHLTESPWPPRS